MTVTSNLVCEVCIDSVGGARAAADGGADRLELCANLLEGGTTPSTGMIRAVLAATSLPVMVMIRPRGGHFTFDEVEWRVMRAEAEAVLELPVAGIVIGALTSTGQVDRSRCRELVQLAAGRSVTFHRAFDQVNDPWQALEHVIDCGVDRILTSGQAAGAPQALERLRALVAAAAGRCTIMPGGGLRVTNVRQVVEQTGAREVHFTGAKLVETPVDFWRSDVPMSAATVPGDLQRRVATATEIDALCRAARALTTH